MGQLTLFVPVIVVLGALVFFASRRQRKAMQATIDLHSSLKIGDRIHTTSGLQGTVTGLTDDDVDLEIAPGVITTWMKLAIRDRIGDDLDDDLDDDGDAPDVAEHADSGYETRESTGTELTDSPNTKTDG